MRLSDAGKGKYYRIEEIELTKDIKCRLTALGLTEDTVILVEENSKGPTIIRARGTRLAMGDKYSRGILVGEM